MRVPRLSAWAIRLAFVYLISGFTLGALMLANKAVPSSHNLWRLLPLHIDFLLFGWMVQFVLGVGFWIFPRFRLPPKHGRSELAWLALGFLNFGIGLVTAGSWQAITGLLLAGRFAEGLAVLLMLVYMWPRIKATETGTKRSSL